MTDLSTENHHYQLRERLGSGDFADTWSAEQDGRYMVAIKHATRPNADAANRLENEIAILPSLTHPGIPAFLDQGQDNEGRPFLVMDLAPGMTLKARIDQHVASNQRFSDIETQLVIRRLLEILCYLSGTDVNRSLGGSLVHRDIKAANIMVSDSLDRVTLIDYGFAKIDGEEDRRYGDSFFRAGAPRYSPPRKLANPALARSSHDVFAIGVIAYLMLTNEFPWYAPDGDDVGGLERMMRSDHPRPIWELNNTVRSTIESFTYSLLLTDDADRPSAEEALEKIHAIDLNTAEPTRPNRRRTAIRYSHVWRDPLWKDIRLTDEEVQVIDSHEIQRLRGFKQLGLTSYVYPGATHSRLLHSVGCVQKVEDVLSTIERVEGSRFDNEFRLASRLYALTHDVSHIPFGHTLEDEYLFFKAHDRNDARVTRLALESSSSELARILESSSVGLEVRKHFDPDSTVHGRSDISELISGPVGADVLDYVDRDAFFLGLDHRVDSALLRQLTFRSIGDTFGEETHLVSRAYGSYGIRKDRAYALESLYESRYALFMKAYTHSGKIMAGVLLAKAVAIAMFEGKNRLREEQIEDLDSDDSLLHLLTGRGERTSRLIHSLSRRRLPLVAYRAPVISDLQRASEDYLTSSREAEAEVHSLIPNEEARLDLEARISRSARVKSEDVFIYFPPFAPGLKRTQSHRFLIDDRGVASAPSDDAWFRRLRRNHLSLWNVWVLVDRDMELDHRHRVGRCAEELFGRENRVATHLRQLRWEF